MTDYAVFQSFAVNERGDVQPYSYVEVTSETTAALATIYTGRTGGALANPFQADSDGYFKFHTVGDFLKIRIYQGPSLSPTFERTFRYVPVGLAGGYDINQLLRLVPDGTVGAPGLAFANDTDTGIYRIGNNNLGIAVGGAKIIDVASSLVSIVAAAALSILSATASTSITTGALTVAGGVGISGALYSGPHSITNNVASGFIDTFAEYQLLLNTQGTAGGSYGLAVRANTFVFNSASAYNWDVNGNSTPLTLTSTTLTVTPSTASSSPTTGALVVTGGVGVSGFLWLADDSTGSALKIGTFGHLIGRLTATGALSIGGGQNSIIFNVTNPVSVLNATASTSSTTGSLIVAGGVGVAGALFAGSTITATSASASALAIGLNGATNPAFKVDASTGSQVAGLNVIGAVTGGTVAIAAIDSGSNTNLTINAKGSGTIGIGSASTGVVTITPATSIVGETTIRSGVATPAGGSTSARMQFGTTGGFGIYYGSGAPTVSAAAGSIYIRTDNAGANLRLYSNTTGSTTWAAITSA